MRLRRWIGTAAVAVVGGPGAVVGAALLARTAMATRAMGRIHASPFALPEGSVLVVLGARVRDDGSAGRALQARIDAAAAAYAAGTVRALVVSGDDGRHRWDEVGVMRDGLRRAGVPSSRIIVDAGARKTRDSVAALARRRPAGVPEQAPLAFVTQRAHAERVLFLADAAGLPARCLLADGPEPDAVVRESVYEAAGALFAVFDVVSGKLRA
ncbi:MAG: hypothetical protein RIT45_652 [Pseudomonadota bacterium]|jgi:vancomycin permeability regulator SanA